MRAFSVRKTARSDPSTRRSAGPAFVHAPALAAAMIPDRDDSPDTRTAAARPRRSAGSARTAKAASRPAPLPPKDDPRSSAPRGKKKGGGARGATKNREAPRE